MQNLDYENVISYLLELVPEFKGLYLEMQEYYDQIFPYVLFSSKLVRFTVQQLHLANNPNTPNKDAQDILRRILEFVETCATAKDDDVIDLIVNGFMECLDENADYYEELSSQLKPKSKELLFQIHRG